MASFEKKYEYIENDPINGGAYGNIYRIRDRKVKTEYVLKKLRKEDPKNPNIKDQQSFENEISFLIKIKGTNIINIIDFYDKEDPKFYYIVLEKMEGDLDSMLNEYKKGMSSKLIRKIFLQLNYGLKTMIDNGKIIEI